MGDNNAAADLVNDVVSESLFSCGSDNTLTTEYTGTVIVGEVTDVVTDDGRVEYKEPAEGNLIVWKVEGAGEAKDFSGANVTPLLVAWAFSTAFCTAGTQLLARMAAGAFSGDEADAWLLKKAAAEGYLIGDANPLAETCPFVEVTSLDGEKDTGANPWVASTTDLTRDDPDVDIDFKGEDRAVGAVVIMDLNGKVEEYIFMVALGEAGGVMVMDDLSSSEPAVDAGDSREENNDEVSPFTEDSGITDAFTGEEIKAEEDLTEY